MPQLPTGLMDYWVLGGRGVQCTWHNSPLHLRPEFDRSLSGVGVYIDPEGGSKFCGGCDLHVPELRWLKCRLHYHTSRATLFYSVFSIDQLWSGAHPGNLIFTYEIKKLFPACCRMGFVTAFTRSFQSPWILSQFNQFEILLKLTLDHSCNIFVNLLYQLTCYQVI